MDKKALQDTLRMMGTGYGRMLLLVVVLHVLAGVGALKDVSVTIPPAARIMDTVTLQCKYDLEGDPLYTVKWYKGAKEFYRYIPKELPNTQVFPLPGIDVDLSKSTPNEVVLRNVQPEVTGKYKCEVSSDAPNFYTHIVAGYMYVIDVPVDDPILQISKELLEMGSTLKGNCTTPPSYPPGNITWYLNGRKINESYLKRVYIDGAATGVTFNSRRIPIVTTSGLELEIDGKTFQGGKARLSCVATVFNLYRREKVVVLEEERPRPRPSSVLGTRDSASDSCWASANLLTVALVTMASVIR